MVKTAVPQPIKWHGGKSYMAKRFIELMPKHTHYVEPFAGGLAVLLEKNPEGVSEVVNDKNGELTNFWQILVHPVKFQQFQRIVQAVPFSEVEFDNAKQAQETLNEMCDDRIPGWVDRLRRAVRFFIVARQSREGKMKCFATLSKNRTRRGMNEQASSWLTAIDGLPEVHERLKRVVILNDDACKVIRQEDSPNSFFYCDPPYLHETRVTTDDYAHEMNSDQHEELLGVLSGIHGKFMLSGYQSVLYSRYATKHQWRREDFEIDCKASAAKEKPKRVECVWMNY